MSTITAHESRALTMGLEAENGLPTGSLQAITEQMTGYRQDNPLLPPHVEPYGTRIEQHEQAAKRFAQKLREFDGVMPLAIDAYYRGDKATQASLENHSFDQDAINNIYATLYRIPKYGGEEFSETDYQVLGNIVGTPNKNLDNVRTTPIPKPAKPLQVKEVSPGTFYTGDLMMDTFINIESRGKPRAVSPTGPVGLLQYTRATAKRFGLMGDGFDHRTDPQASVEAQAQANAVYAASLKRKGIEPTPMNTYLAHQQGEGGIAEIYEAARTGKPVSAQVRQNMDHNGGKGKTPAQFLAHWDSTWKQREAEVLDIYAKSGIMGAQAKMLMPTSNPDGTIAPPQGGELTQEQVNKQNAAQLMSLVPSTTTLDAVAQHGGSTYEVPGQQTAEDLMGQSINWMARLDEVFKVSRPSSVPVDVHNAIKGVWESISNG